MRLWSVLCIHALLMCAARSAYAQDPPPPIGPYVVDLRATFPRFPSDAALAASRGLTQTELPGGALGVDAGVHIYPLTWKMITFGVGGQVSLARARSSPGIAARPVTARLTMVSPQLSLNFGTGEGWSYVSGGVGPSIWAIVPDESESAAADQERMSTINYGGGARWFTRQHVAFHFDLRFYLVGPGHPHGALPGSPATRLLVIGAGVSLR